MLWVEKGLAVKIMAKDPPERYKAKGAPRATASAVRSAQVVRVWMGWGLAGALRMLHAHEAGARPVISMSEPSVQARWFPR